MTVKTSSSATSLPESTSPSALQKLSKSSDKSITPLKIESTTKSTSTSKKTGFFNTFLGQSEYIFHGVILLLICIVAFCIRLFSVVRYESIIHEFDPWFNFRSTKFLVSEGFYAFHNWYDNKSWYPFGRFIGGSVFPGLMWTSAVLYHFCQNILHFTIDIRNICVFFSPLFASFTVLATYLLTREMWNGGAGLFAAAFIALAPGYISRSVAGSYDNEAIAIFALVFCFYLWTRALNTGSMIWALVAALGYVQMVAAWGGYVFIINIIPVHVFVLILLGRYSARLYISYSTFYIFGTLLSMHILFVSTSPAQLNPEHLASFLIFGLVQVIMIGKWCVSLLSKRNQIILLRIALLLASAMIALFFLAAALGKVPFFTARLLSLLGSQNNTAIVKSVSEHQPSPWTSFFLDMHVVSLLAPVGMYFILKHLNDANIFALLYCVFAAYFASIMIRLVLVLTPVACILSGIATSVIVSTYTDVLVSVTVLDSSTVKAKDSKLTNKGDNAEKSEKSDASSITNVPDIVKRSSSVSRLSSILLLSIVSVICYFFTIHCSWVASSIYSSPTIVLMAQTQQGPVYFDDFREAYTWLRHNTPADSKILSWWDYGYQITGMADRTVIVDNNTRNSTHIASVGLVLASPEERAYQVMKSWGVDYALVVYGGVIGYSSDDINKFIWILRITGAVHPEIVETEYFNQQGQYRVDTGASKRMKESLMYKMVYYRYNEYGRQGGLDRVRQATITEPVELKYIEEAFTSEHWMVRIYKIRTPKSHPGFLEELETQKALYGTNDIQVA